MDSAFCRYSCFIMFGAASVSYTHLVQASEDRILELIRGANSEKFEEKKAYRQDLTFQAAQHVFDERKVKFGPQQMRTLGLLNAEGFYTNLALLLSDQCEHSIKLSLIHI